MVQDELRSRTARVFLLRDSIGVKSDWIKALNKASCAGSSATEEDSSCAMR